MVRLSEVANIEYGPVTEKSLFRSQSKDSLNLNSVGLGIYARSGASTVELANSPTKNPPSDAASILGVAPNMVL